TDLGLGRRPDRPRRRLVPRRLVGGVGQGRDGYLPGWMTEVMEVMEVKRAVIPTGANELARRRNGGISPAHCSSVVRFATPHSNSIRAPCQGRNDDRRECLSGYLHVSPNTLGFD